MWVACRISCSQACKLRPGIFSRQVLFAFVAADSELVELVANLVIEFVAAFVATYGAVVEAVFEPAILAGYELVFEVAEFVVVFVGLFWVEPFFILNKVII